MCDLQNSDCSFFCLCVCDSAGLGRSGTFMAIDMGIQQVSVEKKQKTFTTNVTRSAKILL